MKSGEEILKENVELLSNSFIELCKSNTKYNVDVNVEKFLRKYNANPLYMFDLEESNTLKLYLDIREVTRNLDLKMSSTGIYHDYYISLIRTKEDQIISRDYFDEVLQQCILNNQYIWCGYYIKNMNSFYLMFSRTDFVAASTALIFRYKNII